MSDPIQNGIQFHGEPVLVPQADGIHWTVKEDYLVHDPILGDILVKAGFPTDLGSVPKPLWDIIPPTGKMLRAYLIHDWLYAQQFCARKEADDCLKRLMIALAVPEWEYEAIYNGVRFGGQAAWDSDAKENKL